METEASPMYSQPFFALQISLAQKIATLSRQPLAQTLLHSTAFYRIFGLDWSLNPANPIWQAYMQGLQQAEDLTSFTYQFYLQRYPAIPKFSDEEHWGCFAFDYHAETQAVKLHFSDEDRSGYSPLSRHRIAVRKAELQAMFQQIQHRHPEAEIVQGGSWLYHWESYRRLFPPAFGESAHTQKKPGLSGRAIWGQFLRRGWSIHEETMALFLQRVGKLERTEDYAQCFPYPVLLTKAPIDIFYDFYVVH